MITAVACKQSVADNFHPSIFICPIINNLQFVVRQFVPAAAMNGCDADVFVVSRP